MPDRDVVLVFGMTGMGKTWYTRRMLRSIHRAVIMDPQDEYREFQRFEDIGLALEHMERPVFRITHGEPANFKWLCLGARSAGRCWLVIEEAQLIMPAGPEPSREFLDVIYRGRHQEVSVLLVSQRPTTVHIAARSQWSHLITFKQMERADVQWLEATTGLSLPVQELQRGEFLHVSQGQMRQNKLELPPLAPRIDTVQSTPTPTHREA